MTLGNPLIRSFQEGGYPGLGEDYNEPQNFDIFMNWMNGYNPGVSCSDGSTNCDEYVAPSGDSGEFLSNMLQYVFGLQDPERWVDSFANFDEEVLYDLFTGLKSAVKEGELAAGTGVTTAYNEVRKAGAGKGADAGFGASGRALLQALRMVSMKKSQARSGAQQTYEGGVYTEQEDWVDEFMQQLEDIVDQGAQFCQSGEVWNSAGGGQCIEPWQTDDEGSVVMIDGVPQLNTGTDNSITWDDEIYDNWLNWLEVDPETGEPLCPEEMPMICESLGKTFIEDTCQCSEEVIEETCEDMGLLACPEEEGGGCVENLNNCGEQIYEEGDEGCTDPQASNYNPDALVDDNTCEYGEGIPGCTDATAENYNPEATIPDDSCIGGEDLGGDEEFEPQTCEEAGFVTCENGDCAETYEDCGDFVEDEEIIDEGGTIIQCPGDPACCNNPVWAEMNPQECSDEDTIEDEPIICNDDDACNTSELGECEYAGIGDLEGLDCWGNPLDATGFGDCPTVYSGCTDPSADNYDGGPCVTSNNSQCLYNGEPAEGPNPAGGITTTISGCQLGEVMNFAGECVPQEGPDCPTGQVWNPYTGECTVGAGGSQTWQQDPVGIGDIDKYDPVTGLDWWN